MNLMIGNRTELGHAAELGAKETLEEVTARWNRNEPTPDDLLVGPPPGVDWIGDEPFDASSSDAPTDSSGGAAPAYDGFPWAAVAKRSGEFASFADEQLVERLQTLSDCRDASGERIDYLSIREDFCVISAVLNERGRLAPRFREARRPPATTFASRTLGELALGRDRQVIDLDWLAATKWTGEVTAKPEFQNMFRTGLNRSKADRFASTGAPFEEKILWLQLPEDLAWQLDTIQTKAMADHYRSVVNGVERVTVKGKEHMRVTRQIGYRTVLNGLLREAGNDPIKRTRAIRQARAWACGRLTRGDHQMARRVFATWAGLRAPPDAKTFSRLLAPAANRIKTIRIAGTERESGS